MTVLRPGHVSDTTTQSRLLCLALLWNLQRFPTDKAYYIAKEVSTTERTYLKDLEVIASVCAAFPLVQNLLRCSYSNVHLPPPGWGCVNVRLPDFNRKDYRSCSWVTADNVRGVFILECSL